MKPAPVLPGCDIKAPLPTVAKSTKRIKNDKAAAVRFLERTGNADLAEMLGIAS